MPGVKVELNLYLTFLSNRLFNGCPIVVVVVAAAVVVVAVVVVVVEPPIKQLF